MLKHEICNHHGELAAEVEVTSVTISLDNRRAVPVPEALARFFPKSTTQKTKIKIQGDKKNDK